ncbi:hypothetical protein NQ317_005887 [Molorchus minor]|uniref:CBM20 domain-containing protein n=1 Tax=Molorchus minor TaxID=1323400 RepID=A0ABQ9K1H6_9CUCU|nr:hypothetical protein NQ317_005887 [Molorchus minor]
MQCWFFLEDPDNAAIRAGKGDASVSGASADSIEYPPRKWLFRVRGPEVRREETVCVIGDLPELGTWQPEKCIPLEREDDSDIWSGVIEIPEKLRAHFSWETNLQPRLIDANGTSPTYKDEPHEYGCFDNQNE